MCRVARFLTAAARGHIGFATNDGFDAMIFCFLIEIDGAKQIAMIGHGHGWLAKCLYLIKQWGKLIGPIQQAIVSMKVKVDELGGHEGILTWSGRMKKF